MYQHNKRLQPGYQTSVILVAVLYTILYITAEIPLNIYA